MGRDSRHWRVLLDRSCIAGAARVARCSHTRLRLWLERTGDPLPDRGPPGNLSGDVAGMKGYLQRLAASAINPSPAIRPVLGPVYAPRRFEAELEPIASGSESPVETVTEQESPGPRENPQPQPPKASPSPGIPAAVHAIPPRVIAPEEPRVIAPEEPRVIAPEAKGLQAHAEFKPVVQASPSASSMPLAFLSEILMPRSEGNPVSTARPDPPAGAGTEREMPILTGDFRPSDPGPGAARQSELPERFAFEPLIPVPAPIVASYQPGNEHPDTQPSDFEPDPVLLRSQTWDGKADIARRSEPVNRGTLRERSVRREPPVRTQSDEVQIHIGRIEVTAVHPAAPPAARKPTRKSLNLSEYLSRGR